LETIHQKDEIQAALLISVDTGEFDAATSLDELAELAATAGVEVRGQMIQKRESPDQSTCIGSGRLEEIAEICKNAEIPLLIFDRELTATQIRNIEQETGCRVIDRTMLILDIFAGRARSAEGRIQVELAQPVWRAEAPKCLDWAAVSAPGDPVKPNWNQTADISEDGLKHCANSSPRLNCGALPSVHEGGRRVHGQWRWWVTPMPVNQR